MRLRTLLGAVDEAERAGDLSGTSPVFAVVRNEDAALDSPEAWDAISITGVSADSEEGSVVFIADASDDATDISVAALRAHLARLPSDRLERDVSVGMIISPSGELDVRGDVTIVDAYGDEHGLGLMLWFEGYEDWAASQS